MGVRVGHPLNGAFQFLSGAAMFGAFVAGTFFFRFWRQTRDRLFFIFGVSFWLMALERGVVGYLSQSIEHDYTNVFVLRLLSFVLILIAVAEKNWRSKDL